MSVGHVLEPELVVGRVWLVAEFVIDEVDDGTFLVYVLKGINHATDNAKGIVATTDILKSYLGADGRKGTNAATRYVFGTFVGLQFGERTLLFGRFYFFAKVNGVPIFCL